MSSARVNTFSATPPNAARPSLVRSSSRARRSGTCRSRMSALACTATRATSAAGTAFTRSVIRWPMAWPDS